MSVWWSSTRRRDGGAGGSDDASNRNIVAATTATTSVHKQRHTRAVTLHYRVAPAPKDYEAVLHAVLDQAADATMTSSSLAHAQARQQGISNNSSSSSETTASLGKAFVASLVRDVVGAVRRIEYGSVLSTRQRFFDEHFARQLDDCGHEDARVLCSGVCALLTRGCVCRGSVFVTNAALYFTTDRVPSTTTSSTTTTTTAHTHDDDDESADDEHGNAASSGGRRTAAHVSPSMYTGRRSSVSRQRDGGTRPQRVRERLAFARVASVLPSVACDVRRDARNDDTNDGRNNNSHVIADAPYVMGVPCSLVVPNAVQLFAVAPQQVFQLVKLRHVYYATPSSSTTSSSSCEDASSDAWTASEHALLRTMPRAYDTLVFNALVMRVWRRRLRQLGQPERHTLAEYAAPH